MLKGGSERLPQPLEQKVIGTGKGQHPFIRKGEETTTLENWPSFMRNFPSCKKKKNHFHYYRRTSPSPLHLDAIHLVSGFPFPVLHSDLTENFIIPVTQSRSTCQVRFNGKTHYYPRLFLQRSRNTPSKTVS